VSLREAITAASGTPGAVIDFQPGLSGTVTLTLGQLQINDPVTITGPGAGAITISGNNASRIFFVDDRTAAVINVAISGLTLTHGNAGADVGGAIEVLQNDALVLSDTVITGNSAGNDGGGIYVGFGSLTVENAIISDNQSAMLGGGIVVFSGGSLTVDNTTISRNMAAFGGGGMYLVGIKTLVVRNSTISGNSASADGGILFDGDTAEIQNSTISGNSASADGGGIFIESGAAVIGNSTVAFNTADSDNTGGGKGGGVVVSAAGALTLQSTIVADNAVGASGTHPDISGNVTATNCLIENIAGSRFAPGSAANFVGLDPRLGPLQFNGGPTQTHALLAGSPAIHHGSNPLGLTTDQRGFGFTRVAGSAADIGAFEVQAPMPATDQAIRAAVQSIRALQPAGASLAAFAFGDVNGDFVNDIVLALRLRNHKLLIATFDGIDGHIRAVFQPFTAPLRTEAKVRLMLVDVSADPGAEIVLLINGGGPGVPRLSVFTESGTRVL
jgi:hypothetical protein